KLTLGTSEGRIQLVLRNPMDTLKAESKSGVGRRALFGGAPAPAPATKAVVRKPAPPPPPPPPAVVAAPVVVTTATIEVVSGGKKSLVQLAAPEAVSNR